MSEAIISASESLRLAELEEVIEKGIGTFIKVGEALAEIRDSKLYRRTHTTFEDYCREEWEMTARHARNLMGAAEVAQNIAKSGTIVPKREAQARELAALPPEQQPVAWQAAVASANGSQPTAEQVADAVRAVRPLPTAEFSAEEEAEMEASGKDTDTLWNLKRHWRKASKKERAAFTEWVTTAR